MSDERDYGSEGMACSEGAEISMRPPDYEEWLFQQQRHKEARQRAPKRKTIRTFRNSSWVHNPLGPRLTAVQLENLRRVRKRRIEHPDNHEARSFHSLEILGYVTEIKRFHWEITEAGRRVVAAINKEATR